MPVSSCSRGSIENPRTGRCKGINSFTLDELKKLARQQKVSITGTKAEIGQRLIKKFASRVGRSRSRSASKKKTTRRRASTSRGRKASKSKSNSRSRTASKKATRPRKVTRSRSRSSEYYRSLFPRKMRTSRGSYTFYRSRDSFPTKGRGSIQKRHLDPRRKGPIAPAQASRGLTQRGNDGNMWISKPDKNGKYTWRPVR